MGKTCILNLLQSVQHKVYVLSKIRSSITTKTALTIYKCKILPYLDYPDILYNETDKSLTKKLQVLQNRSIRIAFKLSSVTNVDSYYTKLKVLHTGNRKILHLFYIQSISQNPIFSQIRPTTTWFKMSFLYLGITRLNDLPSSFRNLNDSPRFKSAVKRKSLREEVILYS